MPDIESSGHPVKHRNNSVVPDSFVEPFKLHKDDKQIIVTWSNVKYAIPVKNEKMNNVLNNINGEAYPCEILAIMGTSGAGMTIDDSSLATLAANLEMLPISGKSTLLDVIAGRLDSKYLTGSICANDQEVNKRQFRRETGYVMQSDALFPLLTVRETIQYAAELRIINKTREEKKQIANDVIDLLRLTKCADTIIGNDKIRGISGGEKRRVSIGSDIVHQPKVIFLDEPTSGLDSTTAFAIVESLKNMVIDTDMILINIINSHAYETMMSF
jgi:ABC-type multidrug transport system ATPase subunit